MTTPAHSAGGAPYLPPPGDTTPTDIAQALRDPSLLVAADAPYLPPPAPRPVVASAPAFDAKALVEGTKRHKVANPTYGPMPTGTAEGRAAAEAARAKMRRKRRRNKMLGWVTAVTLLVVAGGVSYVLYNMYQDD